MEAGPDFLWENGAHQRRGLEERDRGLVHFLLKNEKVPCQGHVEFPSNTRPH